MLRVFYGDNRGAIEQEIRQILGENYEVYEGEGLGVGDLPSIFRGASLFEEGKRRILLKNLTENAEIWAKIGDFDTTEHEIVIWESKVDKRSAAYKTWKEREVEVREFAAAPRPESKMVFGVLDLAFRDTEKAIKQVEKIELTEDPFMFLGLLVKKMTERFVAKRGAKRERIALKKLAETDILMKSSGVDPWLLIKEWLVEVGNSKETKSP